MRLALGGAAVALFTWWAVHDGGTAPGSWYPGALLFLAALTPVAYALEPGRLSRPALLALAALAAFTVWSFLSITWADARGDAWDGANRTLLYLLVFALFAALPWTAAEASILLGAFALATAVAGAWAVGATLAGSDGSFPIGRLAAPIGYENASAALLLAAFWPAVLIASARSTPAPLRGLLLATAGLLLGLVVLCQSRGSLIAGPAALAVALALVRERRRLVAALSAVAATTLLASPLLLEVYASAPAIDDTLTRAAIALALSIALLAAAGFASARLDARAAGPRPLTRRSLGAALGCALVALALGAGLAVARSGDGAAAPSVGSRFTSGVESGRYDFWRVAWRQFARHPLQGAGADNFAQDYVRERRRGEEPLYPHSIVFRTLGETGIVGVMLLTAFVAAAFAGIRSLDVRKRPPAVAALIAATAWLAHASLDWLWEVPAVAAPAIACLGLVAGLGMTPGGRTSRLAARPCARRRGAGGRGRGLAGAPGARRTADRAGRSALRRRPGRGPARARARATPEPPERPARPRRRRARQPAGDRAAARRAFRRALSRDAGDWYTRTQLGVLDLEAGRRGPALAEFSRARRLNPREPAIVFAADAARRGEPLPPRSRRGCPTASCLPRWAGGR